jgi:hypothetical protein
LFSETRAKKQKVNLDIKGAVTLAGCVLCLLTFILTGGEQFPKLGRSVDHVTLVTVDDEGVDIANLLLAGILDKSGHVPLEGDDLCFETSVCGNDSKLD